MDEERFELLIDSEWWLVRDNNIKSDKYRDDLTGDDIYRGLQEGELTEKEVVEYLNNFYKENQTLNNKLDVHLYLTEHERMKVRGFIKKIEKEKEDAEYELLYLKEGYEKALKENKQLKQFKQNVFALIDKNLEKDKHDYEMTYEDYLNGRIEALEELKKELEE